MRNEEDENDLEQEDSMPLVLLPINIAPLDLAPLLAALAMPPINITPIVFEPLDLAPFKAALAALTTSFQDSFDAEKISVKLMPDYAKFQSDSSSSSTRSLLIKHDFYKHNNTHDQEIRDLFKPLEQPGEKGFILPNRFKV